MAAASCLKKLIDCRLVADQARNEGATVSLCALVDGLAAIASASDEDLAEIDGEDIRPLLKDLKKHHPDALESPTVEKLLKMARARMAAAPA